MNLLNISRDEWRTLVIVPAVVSLVINICTPLAQRAAASLLVRSAAHMHGGLDGLIRLRIKQIDQELSELQKLQNNQKALLMHYQTTVSYMSWGLWILLLSPIAGLLAQALASHYAHHLPWGWDKLFSIPGMAFAFTVGSMFAAGPLQAAIYSSFIRRRLKKLLNNPESLLDKIELERTKLTTLISITKEKQNS